MYKWALGALLLGLVWRYGFHSEQGTAIQPPQEYDYIVAFPCSSALEQGQCFNKAMSERNGPCVKSMVSTTYSAGKCLQEWCDNQAVGHVGGGSAGGIVAARLSEDTHHQVALLEAGADNDEYPDTLIPAYMWIVQKTDVDWQYETVPQKHACKGLINKKSAWPRGKALGGSSLINGMTAIRGSRHDYDLWAEMGNTEWSYEKVLPFFKKMENVAEDKLKQSGYRGTNGPVNVEEKNPYPELMKAVLNATESSGHKTRDVNGEDIFGWMIYQGNQDHGVRESTARAYIKPAMSRPNFHVLTKAHVTKVIFEGKRAVGVEYMQDGRMKTLKAKKEIILSAGAIGSPQILMLSGIGPKEHLEELKIPMVADLPVGKHLIDHLMTDAPVYTVEKPVCSVHERLGMGALLEYKMYGTGPLTCVGIVGTGFDYSKFQPKDRKDPYIQYLLFAGLNGNHPDVYNTMMKDLNMDPDVFEALNGDLDGRDGITMMPNLIHPFSEGEIKLKSTNPFDHPLIDPNYLSDERDVKVFVEAIRKAQDMLEEPAMKALGAKRLERVHPLCKEHKYDSDDYWACYVRSNTFTVYHPAGTCKMGPDGDQNSVVDSHLRVRNVEGLRVADASIMPHITSGNTNFPCMMIGERAADLIKHWS